MPEDALIKTLASPLSAEATLAAFCDLTAWWPLDGHSVSAQQLGQPARSAEMTQAVGAEIFEIAADGARHPWGEVLSASPGAAISFTWRPGGAPETATRIDIAVAPAEGGATLTLTHGGWAARGETAEAMRAQYDTGWDHVLGDRLGGRLAALAAGAAA